MLISFGLAAALALGSVAPAMAVVESVGGGTWNHGLTSSPRGVWSNYVHNGKMHSATSIVDSHNVKVIQQPRIWANTSAQGSGVRYAYWDAW